MRAKAFAALGLWAISSVASAQPPQAPGVPGLTGALGDELYYNYLEGFVGAAYVDKGGRNQRVASDDAYGFSGSVFLFDPIFVNASYANTELSYNTTANNTTSRIKVEAEHTSAGLGIHLPVGFATDLFGVVSYEKVDGRERTRTNSVSTPSALLDGDGIGYEGGLRSFISGFAELSISYRYREIREETRRVSGGARQILRDRFGVIGLVVPVFSRVSLFARAEIGEKDSNFVNSDEEFERYLLGARFNFSL